MFRKNQELMVAIAEINKDVKQIRKDVEELKDSKLNKSTFIPYQSVMNKVGMMVVIAITGAILATIGLGK